MLIVLSKDRRIRERRLGLGEGGSGWGGRPLLLRLAYLIYKGFPQKYTTGNGNIKLSRLRKHTWNPSYLNTYLRVEEDTYLAFCTLILSRMKLPSFLKIAQGRSAVGPASIDQIKALNKWGR